MVINKDDVIIKCLGSLGPRRGDGSFYQDSAQSPMVKVRSLQGEVVSCGRIQELRGCSLLAKGIMTLGFDEEKL